MNERDGERSKNIFPAQVIELILKRWNDKIKYITLLWVADNPNGSPFMQKNLQAYRDALEQGMTKEQAVMQTWSGKLFSELQFGKIRKVDDSTGDVHVELVRDSEED